MSALHVRLILWRKFRDQLANNIEFTHAWMTHFSLSLGKEVILLLCELQLQEFDRFRKS